MFASLELVKVTLKHNVVTLSVIILHYYSLDTNDITNAMLILNVV